MGETLSNPRKTHRVEGLRPRPVDLQFPPGGASPGSPPGCNVKLQISHHYVNGSVEAERLPGSILGLQIR